MKDNVPEVKDAMDRQALMFGTVDTWLVYVRLSVSPPSLSLSPVQLTRDAALRAQQYTGGKDGGKHITDGTNACRTLLFNLHKQDWCDELCDFFNVPKWCLPRIVSNSEVYGVFKKGHLLEGIPIAGLIGDQQAALVGNKCLTKGDAKNTYGALSLSTSSSRRAAKSCCLAARQSHALADPSTRNRQSHCRYGLLHALQHGHRHCQVDAWPRHHRASPLAVFR